MENNKANKRKSQTWPFIKSKWYLFLLLLITMFVGVTLGYIAGPIQRDKSIPLFAVIGVVLIILGSIDMVIILYLRKKINANKDVYKDLMFMTFFIFLFFSGLVLTIFFRLLALNKPDSFLNKGNLVSLLCSITYLLLLAMAVFFPLYQKNEEEANEQVIEEKQGEVIETPVSEVALVISEPVVETKVAPALNQDISVVDTPKQEKKDEGIQLTKEELLNLFVEIKLRDIVKEEMSKYPVEKKKPQKKYVTFRVPYFDYDLVICTDDIVPVKYTDTKKYN